MTPDLILLHAPSVYDFRKKPMLYGPVSDVIPSTQIFEMYPIGFMTMLAHLQRHGYSARIINIALKMLRSRRFDAEKLIRKLKPAAFGIDLHWMVHAHGSLALAAIIKKYHPTIPVIFGGLSSSYYHKELIRYPQVDYVIRGDSAEEPLRQLLAAIKTGQLPEHVPNLTWKDNGQIRVNTLSPSPVSLDDLSLDYQTVIKSTLRSLDFFGHVPFNEWPKYPIVMALSCRGCTHNCVICGGSSFGYMRTSEHKAPIFRSPELLAKDIGLATRYIKAPTFVLGDLMQAGEEYTLRFLDALQSEKIRSHIAIEFFRPPPRRILVRVAEAVPNFNIQISPETHDDLLRRRAGRPYDNAALERMMADALEVGCKRFDLFFLIGLPGQTPQSVRETIAYCRTLLDRFGRDSNTGWLHPYISPLAPFLDPGSRAFEHPEKHGYRVFFRTLEEHRQALDAPSWKYTLNYETNWMTRDDITAITYEAAFALNRLKAEYGLQDRNIAKQIEARIRAEQHLMYQIDAILASCDTKASQGYRIEELLRRFKRIGPHTLCHEHEMKWPVHFLRFNPLRILQGLFLR